MKWLGDLLSSFSRVAPRAFRLACFVFVLSTFVMWGAVKIVRARVEHNMLLLGQELLRFPGTVPDRTRVLYLNGFPFNLQVSTVRESFDQVLDHYESTCGGRHGGLGVASNLLRARNDASGFVACIDLGMQELGFEAIRERAESALVTGDVGEIGPFRYVWARSTNAGDGTLLISLWTDSEINLYSILSHGDLDVAGQDVPDVPRPQGSHRILSTWEEGKPYSLTTYRGFPASPEALEKQYRQLLPEHEWTVVEHDPGESVQVREQRILAAQKDGRFVTLVFSQGKDRSGVLTVLTSDSL